MRHIFIINPAAGQPKKWSRLKQQIETASEKLGVLAEYYETKHPGDGERFVRSCCEKSSDHVIRFYACGGDGALNEVVNGMFGFKKAEAACIPMGTGNDYVRNYDTEGDFLDVEAQLLGQAVDSDVIGYQQGHKNTQYCINMFNIGFDCSVVDQTVKTKRWPLIKGSFAYLLSIAITLIKKKGADLQVQFEDGSVFDGKLLLIAIANGCYCGGGVKGVPLCKLDDGLMDVSLIKDISRRLLISLFPKYAKGKHLEDKRKGDYIIYKKCRTLTIMPNNKSMQLCVDGEIISTGKVTFHVIPKGIRFSVPIKR